MKTFNQSSFVKWIRYVYCECTIQGKETTITLYCIVDHFVVVSYIDDH